MDIPDINDNIDLLMFLRESGILEHDPYLKYEWNWAWQTQDYTRLHKYIESHPGLLQQAKRLAIEKQVAVEKNPLRPVPEGPEMQLIDGDIKVGWVNHRHEYSSLNPIDFTRGFFCCGPPGSGKTTLRLFMLDQMFHRLPEERTYRILIIQDAKPDADYLIREYPYIKIINEDDLRIAMNNVESWDNFKEKITSNKKVFQTTNWFMQHSQLIFGMAQKRCFDRYESTGLPPNYADIKKEIPAAIEELGLEGYEHKNAIDHVYFALETFIQTGPMLNCRAGLTVEDFWSKNDVILNIMDIDSEFVRRTLVQTLITDLKRYYIKHPLETKELRHLVDVDECRDIFPVKGANSQTDHNPHKSMTDWVAQRRSSGMGYMAFTQEIESAPDWLIDNSAYVVCFPIIGKNRNKMMEVLNLDERT